jgi:hypothetical protein
MGPETTLQFDRVESDSTSSQATKCTECSQSIYSVYYESGGNILCERCKLEGDAPVAGWAAGRFGRALLAGSGAAIAGSLVYYAVSALTGYQFGLIAIVVGLAVGKAVRWGSKNRGGWRYQTIAVALTYLSIVATYVPYVFQGMVEAGKEESTATPGATNVQNTKPVEASAAETVTPMQFVTALLVFGLVVLAAPFLAGFENIIGLLIIAFGLFEAWKINRKVERVVNGPFRVGEAAPAPPAP